MAAEERERIAELEKALHLVWIHAEAWAQNPRYDALSFLVMREVNRVLPGWPEGGLAAAVLRERVGLQVPVSREVLLRVLEYVRGPNDEEQAEVTKLLRDVLLPYVLTGDDNGS